MLTWHGALAWALIAVNALAGVWALAAQRWPALRGWPLWSTIIAAQVLAVAQAITGSILIADDRYQAPELHALYGFSSVVAVGILYSYRSSSFMRGKEHLLYGLGCLFIMGLGLREVIALS